MKGGGGVPERQRARDKTQKAIYINRKKRP